MAVDVTLDHLRGAGEGGGGDPPSSMASCTVSALAQLTSLRSVVHSDASSMGAPRIN